MSVGFQFLGLYRFYSPTIPGIVTGVCADPIVVIGSSLYFDSTFGSTGGYRLAVAGTNPTKATLIGLAATNSVSGQPIDVIVSGDIIVNAGSLTVFQGLWLNSTISTVVPQYDVSPPSTVGYYTSFLGMYVGGSQYLKIRLAITPHNGLPFGMT